MPTAILLLVLVSKIIERIRTEDWQTTWRGIGIPLRSSDRVINSTLNHHSGKNVKCQSVHAFKGRCCKFADPNHWSDTVQSLLPGTVSSVSLLFFAVAGFLSVPSISKAVAFSLWFMGQQGSLRCLCDKYSYEKPIISFSAQCSSSFHKCLDVCKLEKIESQCSQSIHVLSIPLSSRLTPHLWLLCHLCSYLVFLLAAQDAMLMDSPIVLVLCPELCCLVCFLVVGMLHSYVHHPFIPPSCPCILKLQIQASLH